MHEVGNCSAADILAKKKRKKTLDLSATLLQLNGVAGSYF